MGYVEACVFMLFIATLSSFTIGDPQVPCYFIFADSLYDNDNNNDLVTEAKVNFPPYGVDLPDGPTGRFSKGRNIADVIGVYLFLFIKYEWCIDNLNLAIT
ncbi:putative triacylglycerol lipase [Helianthus annuus]|nr:putative triacylglycerol lipase [Helianthus annuus]